MATPDEVIAAACEALVSPAREVRHADKRIEYKSAADILEDVRAADLLNGAEPQFLVVGRPVRPLL